MKPRPGGSRRSGEHKRGRSEMARPAAGCHPSRPVGSAGRLRPGPVRPDPVRDGGRRGPRSGPSGSRSEDRKTTQDRQSHLRDFERPPDSPQPDRSRPGLRPPALTARPSDPSATVRNPTDLTRRSRRRRRPLGCPETRAKRAAHRRSGFQPDSHRSGPGPTTDGVRPESLTYDEPAGSFAPLGTLSKISLSFLDRQRYNLQRSWRMGYPGNVRCPIDSFSFLDSVSPIHPLPPGKTP